MHDDIIICIIIIYVVHIVVVHVRIIYTDDENQLCQKSSYPILYVYYYYHRVILPIRYYVYHAYNAQYVRRDDEEINLNCVYDTAVVRLINK
jgi:hypothetical protein